MLEALILIGLDNMKLGKLHKAYKVCVERLKFSSLIIECNFFGDYVKRIFESVSR